MWYKHWLVQTLIVIIIVIGICIVAKIRGSSVVDDKGITVHVGK